MAGYVRQLIPGGTTNDTPAANNIVILGPKIVTLGPVPSIRVGDGSAFLPAITEAFATGETVGHCDRESVVMTVGMSRRESSFAGFVLLRGVGHGMARRADILPEAGRGAASR